MSQDAGAPDEHILTARNHWFARFNAAGVPAADFHELVNAIDRWEDWCRIWSERAAVHEDLGRRALAENQNVSAATHLVHASIEYHFAKFYFMNDMPQMRAAHAKAVECRTLALPHLSPPGERVEIPFEGKALYGNLRKPAGTVGPAPVVVIISGADSTKEEMHGYEQLLLARGLATLAFDGPGQGEAEYDFPMRHSFEEPVGAVIDWIEGRVDLDAGRVGLFGTSLGAYYAQRAAAFEKRVAAAVANSGAYRVTDNFDQRPQLLKDAYKVRTHSASVEEAREKTKAFDMTGVASQITCPMFIVAAKADRITKWEDAARVAEEVNGPCVFVALEGGVHVGHNRVHLWRPQCADWLAAQLGLPKT